MRLFQRDRTGRVIEALAPLTLCVLVIDRQLLRPGVVSRATRKAIRRFFRALEEDRDAAAVVRLAVGVGGLRDAAANDFGRPGLARVHLSSEGDSPSVAAAIEEAYASLGRAAADFARQGKDVRASYLVALTHNERIRSGQGGDTLLLSFADSGFADPGDFLGRCVRMLLDGLESDGV